PVASLRLCGRLLPTHQRPLIVKRKTRNLKLATVLKIFRAQHTREPLSYSANYPFSIINYPFPSPHSTHAPYTKSRYARPRRPPTYPCCRISSSAPASPA